MKPRSIIVALVAIALVGGTGYVIGAQEQQHDLGLDQALPETDTISESNGDLPGIPVSGNAVFRVVGQEDGIVLVELMIKQGDTWHPAKIQASGSGFQYAGEK
jgi:hypothetical protein